MPPLCHHKTIPLLHQAGSIWVLQHVMWCNPRIPGPCGHCCEVGPFCLMWYMGSPTGGSKAASRLTVELAKALLAGKANLYPRYMLIQVKMSHCLFQGGRSPISQLAMKWLVVLFAISFVQHRFLFLDGWTLARAVTRSAFMGASPFCWATAYPSLLPWLFCSWTLMGRLSDRGWLRSAGTVALSAWLFMSFVWSVGCCHVIETFILLNTLIGPPTCIFLRPSYSQLSNHSPSRPQFTSHAILHCPWVNIYSNLRSLSFHTR